jgi:hypothetical protein
MKNGFKSIICLATLSSVYLFSAEMENKLERTIYNDLYDMIQSKKIDRTKGYIKDFITRSDADWRARVFLHGCIGLIDDWRDKQDILRTLLSVVQEINSFDSHDNRIIDKYLLRVLSTCCSGYQIHAAVYKDRIDFCFFDNTYEPNIMDYLALHSKRIRLKKPLPHEVFEDLKERGIQFPASMQHRHFDLLPEWYSTYRLLKEFGARFCPARESSLDPMSITDSSDDEDEGSSLLERK